MNQDYGFLIQQLAKENEKLNEKINTLEKRLDEGDKDWDNATLMRNWGISKRTAKNYREEGLEYYRLGRNGPIFYTHEGRERFKVWFNKKTKGKKIPISNQTTSIAI